MRRDALCFYCNKLIVGEYYLLGLDIPYVNLWFHKECFKLVLPKLLLYLTENAERCYNYKYNGDLKKKK